MATGGHLQRQLSLVPYATESREIVLRHGSAVVVYDPELRQLSLQDASQETFELDNCPYCHRPLQEEAQATDDEVDDVSSAGNDGFVNPQYFRMLAHSTPGSNDSSTAPSPRRHFPALRSPTSRDVSGPPTGSSFVSSTPAPQSTEHGISGSSFTPGYFKTFFVEKRELGRGGRGVVLLVEHFLDGVSLGDFACKRIPVGNDHDWLVKVLIEVQLLQSLNHQNLVSYRHVWLEDAQLTKFGPSVPCVYILQQYCNAGDLHDYILSSAKSTTSTAEEMKDRRRRRSQGLPEPPTGLREPRRMQLDEIFSFFRDITSGLHHLHTNGYIHRDLKPSNCLLHRTGQKISVHVSDFGEVQPTTATRESTGATGTISYCAPEVLQQDTPGGTFGNFSTKSDVFSLGMIVYFMCFGRLPYVHADDVNEENEDLEKLRAEITTWAGFDDTAKLRQDLPERLYRFLKRLLSLNPAERPSTEEILQAIKAGAGLEDFRLPSGQQPAFDEKRPRFSAVESPAPEMATRARNGSVARARPGLSHLGRHSSGDVVRSRITRKVDKSPLSPITAGEQSPSSPRLMLPPPPTKFDFIMHSLDQPVAIAMFRAIMFLAKIFTLSYPCSPYAAGPWVMYPLLCLAALDLGPLSFSWSTSLGLSGLHLAVVLMVMRWGRLCTGKAVAWEDF